MVNEAIFIFSLTLNWKVRSEKYRFGPQYDPRGHRQQNFSDDKTLHLSFFVKIE